MDNTVEPEFRDSSLVIREVESIFGELEEPIADALLSLAQDDVGLTLDRAIYHVHYAKQALRNNPEAVLIFDNPLETNFGAFETGTDWSENQQMISAVVENYDGFIDSFKASADEHNIGKILQSKSLIIPVNHQSYFNPAGVAHGLSVACKDLYGIDVRPNIYMPVGPLIVSSASELNGKIHYVPDVLSKYSNWFLTVPDNSRHNITGSEKLIRKIRYNAMRRMLPLLKTPGSIFIIAPSGGRDVAGGMYREAPSDSSYSLVAPSSNSAVLPIALADSGSELAYATGFKLPVGVAIGGLHESDDRRPNKDIGQSIVDDELYRNLVLEANARRLEIIGS